MSDRRDQGAVPQDPGRTIRLRDAARIMPFVAVGLMVLPVLWSAGSATSSAMIYIFSVWGILILLIGLLSRSLGKDVARESGSNAKRGITREP